MANTIRPTIDDIWKILKEVPDPEIPVINILDLGIVRNVSEEDDKIIVSITPTYSGCPAMDAIAIDIRLKLAEHGITNVVIKNTLSPSWTTEWITEEGKQKLKAYGIAPPHLLKDNDLAIECPQCNSSNTSLISQFGSTACKSLYKCEDCKEVFDHFKCH